MIDYTQWVDDPFLLANAEVVLDYAEYSGEDPFDIAEKIRAFQTLTAPEYSELGESFYLESKNYIYDVLGANPTAGVRANLLNKFIPNCIAEIKSHPGKAFADFGAGVGTVCELAHTFCGKEVTHVDVNGPLLNFAKWRYQKYGWNIKVEIIPSQTTSLSQSFDIILTDAVWEHLNPELQVVYAHFLPNCIIKDGLLFFLVDLSGPSPEMPMHFAVDIKLIHDTLEKAGMKCEYGRDSFASVWIKL